MPVNMDLMSTMAMGEGGFQSPGSITTRSPKPMDWDLIAMMLGSAGQAFSAQDPQSWQYQMGGAAAGLGRSSKFAKAATKAQAGRRENWEWIQSILGGMPTPKGIPGMTSSKIDAKGELTIGYTPERDIFGLGPLSTGGIPQMDEPSPTMGYGETPEPGGAGGRDVMHPFLEGLSEPSSQQRIW